MTVETDTPSDREFALMKISGALAVVAFFAFEAETTVSGPAPIGSPETHAWLLELRAALTKWQHESTTRAGRRGP